jgi:RNA polymerase sigma-70 factor, ECF subfamily
MTPANVALEHLVLTEPTDERRPGAVEALVVRAQQGDVQAFGTLVFQFEEKVLTTAWRFLRDRDDAMDAAQEAFLRARKYLGSYRGPDFGAWLYRITVNVTREMAKRRAPPPAAPAAQDEQDEQEGSFPPTGSARRFLEQALQTLTEKERTAFVMRDLDGRSTSEVARVLGMSATTVRVHICMARKKIRRFLGEER